MSISLLDFLEEIFGEDSSIIDDQQFCWFIGYLEVGEVVWSRCDFDVVVGVFQMFSDQVYSVGGVDVVGVVNDVCRFDVFCVDGFSVRYNGVFRCSYGFFQ